MSATRTTSSGACGRPSGRPTSKVPIVVPRDRSDTASPSVGVAMRTGAASGAGLSSRARSSGAGPGRAAGSNAARSSGSSSSSAWVSAARRCVPASDRYTAHQRPSRGTTTWGTTATASSTDSDWPSSSLASAR